jgi:hypothetical protein
MFLSDWLGGLEDSQQQPSVDDEVGRGRAERRCCLKTAIL